MVQSRALNLGSPQTGSDQCLGIDSYQRSFFRLTDREIEITTQIDNLLIYLEK